MSSITIEELKKLPAESYQIIDVRDEIEISHGAVKGALACKPEEIMENPEVDKTRKLVICCSRGINSKEIAKKLEEEGLDAVSLEKGYIAWLMDAMKSSQDEDFAKNVEISLRKKFKKKIWSRFTKAINTYELVKPGDRIAQLFSRKGEKLGKLVYIGALVAIVGVVLVVLNGTLSFHLSPLGDLLALAAALMWAVYSILVKKYTERYDNFLVTRRVFLWAFLTSLPLVLLTDGMPSLSPLFSQPKILISWLFLGVFGNAVCFAIWNIAFKRLGVVVTNNYLYASPFVTVVVGWLLLGERISWMSILGAVLITLGVIFANKDSSQS